MTITEDFAYHAPTSLSEAVGLLETSGPRARVLAGGTDLVPWLRDQVLEVSALIDLKGVRELAVLSAEHGRLTVGALVTFSELVVSPLVGEHIPLIAEMASSVASVGIRNRATLVGNVCSAVPSCDAGPVLLAHDAKVHLVGPAGPRSVPISEWFLGPRQTALAAGEVVTKVSMPIPQPPYGAAYPRLTRYRGEDLAQASVAIAARMDGSFRVAFGAVTPTPFRALDLERALENDSSGPAITEVGRLVPSAIAPITDSRATKEYRSAMSEVLFVRTARTAVARHSGAGAPYGTHLM